MRQQWSKYPIIIIPFIDEKAGFKFGVGIRCDKTHFYWAKEGTFEPNFDYEKSVNRKIYACCKKPQQYLAVAFIMKIICPQVSTFDIFQDLKSWMDPNFNPEKEFPMKAYNRNKKCNICLEICRESELKQCSLKCVSSNSCKRCLIDYFQSKIPNANANKCIDQKCQGSFLIEDFHLLLSKGWYNAYSFGNSSAIQCFHCRLDVWYDKNDIQNEFECPYCNEQTCFKCLNKIHPMKPCKITEVKNVELPTNSIKCSNCHYVGIADVNACNKIQCSNCNQCEMCACCQKTIKNEYNHFCRSFIDSKIDCKKMNCLHCFLWPNAKVASNADPVFIAQHPQFRGIQKEKLELFKMGKHFGIPKENYKGGLVFPVSIGFQHNRFLYEEINRGFYPEINPGFYPPIFMDGFYDKNEINKQNEIDKQNELNKIDNQNELDDDNWGKSWFPIFAKNFQRILNNVGN